MSLSSWLKYGIDQLNFEADFSALALSLDSQFPFEDQEARKVVLLDSEQDALPFDRIQCPTLVEIGRAWEAMPREGDARLPQWRCFRPFAFKSCIEKMCVISVDDWRAEKLEFTLYGNHPTEIIGLGRPLSLQALRHDPKRRQYFEDIRNRVGRAIEHEAPQYAQKTLSWNDCKYVQYETLMLPFAREGTVQRILQPVSARIGELD